MKKYKAIPSLLIAAIITANFALTANAADYDFSSGGYDFGSPTSTERSVTPDETKQNVRRNKDAAETPPPYGTFSGEFDTEPTSPYHNNRQTSGFVTTDQDFPAVGNEGNAFGQSNVTVSETKITDVSYYSDSSIGTLSIPSQGVEIKVYEGETLENMKKGIGHFASTSGWDGNVGFAGHNRGAAAYFGFVKNLKIGDKITYTTPNGTREYEVFVKKQIEEIDFSSLSASDENILTLITCVENVPELRWCVQAREVKN
jgi:sortase A